MNGIETMTYGNKKIIVTGITGLIGNELIEPLQNANFEIYGITIHDQNLNSGVNWIKGSLFDDIFIKKIMAEVKPKYLLNMAWATTGDYLTSDINYDFLNAGVNLLKYFKDNGGKRAIYAGTCFEYQFKNNSIKETDLLDTEKTVYTFCKNKLHEIAAYFCKTHDISFGYGRIFYVYGRNEDKTRLTGMVIDKLSKNENVIIKSGSLIKDYMYTKDIAGAFVRFLESNITGAVNICTGQGILIRDFVLQIAEQLNKKHLITFKEEKSNQPPMIVGDNTILTQKIGYQYKYTLQEAISEIIASYTPINS